MRDARDGAGIGHVPLRQRPQEDPEDSSPRGRFFPWEKNHRENRQKKNGGFIDGELIWFMIVNIWLIYGSYMVYRWLINMVKDWQGWFIHGYYVWLIHMVNIYIWLIYG